MDCGDFNSSIYRKRACIVCGEKYSSVADLERHLLESHSYWQEQTEASLVGGSTDRESDIKFTKKDFIDGVFTEYTADCSDLQIKNCEDLLSFIFEDILEVLQNELRRKRSMKSSIAIETLFSKHDISSGNDVLTEPMPVFNSFQHAIFNQSMIPRFIRIVCAKITQDHEFFTALRSGWNVVYIANITLKVIQIAPITGGSYIDLPIALKHKERSGTILNIFNPADEYGSENLCFVYSVLAHDDIAGLKGKHRSRTWRNVSSYRDPDIFQRIKWYDFPYQYGAIRRRNDNIP